MARSRKSWFLSLLPVLLVVLLSVAVVSAGVPAEKQLQRRSPSPESTSKESGGNRKKEQKKKEPKQNSAKPKTNADANPPKKPKTEGRKKVTEKPTRTPKDEPNTDGLIATSKKGAGTTTTTTAASPISTTGPIAIDGTPECLSKRKATHTVIVSDASSKKSRSEAASWMISPTAINAFCRGEAQKTIFGRIAKNPASKTPTKMFLNVAVDGNVCPPSASPKKTPSKTSEKGGRLAVTVLPPPSQKKTTTLNQLIKMCVIALSEGVKACPGGATQVMLNTEYAFTFTPEERDCGGGAAAAKDTDELAGGNKVKTTRKKSTASDDAKGGTTAKKKTTKNPVE